MQDNLRQAAQELDSPITDSPTIYHRPILTQPEHKPMSPETRAKYAEFFDGPDEYLRSSVDHDLQEIAKASEKMRTYNKELAIIEDLRSRNNQAADEYKARTMNIIVNGKEARDRLKTLKVGEVFNVDEALADKMQKLCSYYNKESNQRYKTRRAPSNNQVLQIKRIR